MTKKKKFSWLYGIVYFQSAGKRSQMEKFRLKLKNWLTLFTLYRSGCEVDLHGFDAWWFAK